MAGCRAEPLVPSPNIAFGDSADAPPGIEVVEIRQWETTLPPPVCHESVHNRGIFTTDNLENSAQGYPARYPAQPRDSHLCTNIDWVVAMQPGYSNQELIPWSYQQHSRPLHLRSLKTARRWLICVNAIQRDEPGAGIALESNNTIRNCGYSQYDQNRPSRDPLAHQCAPNRRGRGQQNDETIHRELVRGFQVLWNRAG